MISQVLQKARNYEEEAEKNILKEERPEFHLSTRTGWMNDPNGFSYYNGEYHMFYQYHPYDSNWGPMHWGHAVSKDLLHWEYLPVALAPDEDYDKLGCFSGSALTLKDGRQLLMYTGVSREEDEQGKSFDVQTQCLAVGDGKNYQKYEKNPVLTGNDLPEGCSKLDFRDPKMWEKEDGSYCCVVGNRPSDGSGQILLFSSPDGFKWSFEKVLVENKKRFGKMWECPDFFSLNGKWVLLTSPQDMMAKGLEYENGNGTLCLIGEYDEVTNTFKEEKDQAIDYGIDFYAPQTVVAPDGRRIMIGWMQNWDSCCVRSEKDLWFGQMSLPRELSLKNGRLYQKPMKELESMRHNKVEYQKECFSGEMCLEKVNGRKIDMELLIRPEKEENCFRKFELRFAKKEEQYTSLKFYPEESILEVDRKFSGVRRASVHQRQCRVDFSKKELKLRVILDRFSVEVFVNDGEQVLTMAIYTPQEAEDISFLSDEKVNMDIVKYDL